MQIVDDFARWLTDQTHADGWFSTLATTMALMILDPAGSAAYEEAMRKLSAELRGGRPDD